MALPRAAFNEESPGFWLKIGVPKEGIFGAILRALNCGKAGIQVFSPKTPFWPYPPDCHPRMALLGGGILPGKSGVGAISRGVKKGQFEGHP